MPRECTRFHRANSQPCLEASVSFWGTSNVMMAIKCQQQRDTFQFLGWGSMSKASCDCSEVLPPPLPPPSNFNLQITGAGRSTGAKGFCQAQLKAAAAAVAAGRDQPEMTSPSCSSSSFIFIPSKSPAKLECSLKRPSESIQPTGGTHRHCSITAALRVLIIAGRRGWTEEPGLFLSTLGRS